jgi:hypothetical protein
LLGFCSLFTHSREQVGAGRSPSAGGPHRVPPPGLALSSFNAQF